MALKKSVLVVANVTATSDELVNALTERAQRDPAEFTLVVPATRHGGGPETAEQVVQQAVQRLREAGLEARGSVGHSDPIVAVSDAWDPSRYDEVILSTLPAGASRWLHGGLPERIFRMTGVPVVHIVSEPPKPPIKPGPAPEHDDGGGLGPLSVLAWGKHPEPERRHG